MKDVLVPGIRSRARLLLLLVEKKPFQIEAHSGLVRQEYFRMLHALQPG